AVLEHCGPLTGRPVHPVVADDVAGLRTAEREVLEVAGETLKVRADRQAADGPVERAAEELLIEGEHREVPGLATPIHFLDELVVPDAGVGAEIAAVAIRQRDLEGRAAPANELIEIERRAEIPLIGVRRHVLGAAAEVVRGLTDVAEIEFDAGGVGARSAPVAEQQGVLACPRCRRGDGRAQRQRDTECDARTLHLRCRGFHVRSPGSANAISESPILVPSEPWPPAMITTYCLP